MRRPRWPRSRSRRGCAGGDDEEARAGGCRRENCSRRRQTACASRPPSRSSRTRCGRAPTGRTSTRRSPSSRARSISRAGAAARRSSSTSACPDSGAEPGLDDPIALRWDRTTLEAEIGGESSGCRAPRRARTAVRSGASRTSWKGSPSSSRAARTAGARRPSSPSRSTPDAGRRDPGECAARRRGPLGARCRWRGSTTTAGRADRLAPRAGSDRSAPRPHDRGHLRARGLRRAVSGLEFPRRPGDRGPFEVRGKSGHHRAECWGNPRRRKPTESGTERRPPTGRLARLRR